MQFTGAFNIGTVSTPFLPVPYAASLVLSVKGQGNAFSCTLTGGVTIANPAQFENSDGTPMLIELVQDGPGSRLITAFGNKFQFSTGLPLPVLSTAGGTRDLLGFIYRQATDRWMYVGQVFGFT